VPSARDVTEKLKARGINLKLGSSAYDLSGPMGKIF
jgi:hypothetical protein